jgi:hypothetical protein
MSNGDVKTGISILEEKRKILDTELKTERQAALLGDEKAEAKINAAEAELEQVKKEITKLGQRPGGDKPTTALPLAEERAKALKHIKDRPELKAKIEAIFKTHYPNEDLYAEGDTIPKEKPRAADSLVPSEDVTMLPRKVDVTKRTSSSEENNLVRDPLTLEFITRKEYKKKYGESPK